MNDIDRSVENIDFALRRRFAWKEIKPKDRLEMLSGKLDHDTYEKVIRVMEALNTAISNTRGLGSAYQLGPAYFLKSDKDNDKINAAIYIDGRNINKSLLESGQATKKDKLDAIGSKALTGQFGQLYGATMEAIGHAPIPFIHNKFMRIDTPLESYKNEQVYGTSDDNSGGRKCSRLCNQR